MTTTTDVELRWDVRSEMIDVDRMAAVWLAARLQQQGRAKRPISKWYWVIIPVLWVAIGVLVSPSTAIFNVALVVAVVIAAYLWNRSTARRLANRLRKVPAATEAYSFVASPTGAEAASASSRSQMAWSRFSDVMEVEDHTVLVGDDGLMRLLPHPAFSSRPQGLAPHDAAAAIRQWLPVLPPS